MRYPVYSFTAFKEFGRSVLLVTFKVFEKFWITEKEAFPA